MRTSIVKGYSEGLSARAELPARASRTIVIAATLNNFSTEDLSRSRAQCRLEKPLCRGTVRGPLRVKLRPAPIYTVRQLSGEKQTYE